MRSAGLKLLVAGVLLCAPVSTLRAQIPPVADHESGSPAQSSQPTLPFRLLDQDRLLSESRIGQDTLARISTAQAQLEAENLAIFEQLSAEEQELTDLRATLNPSEFRARADAFDERVERIRAERANLSAELDQARQNLISEFFEAALPVLQQYMQEQGILGLLRNDAMVMSSGVLDITDEVIARLDSIAQQDAPAQDNAD